MSRADDIYRKEQEIDAVERDMRSINPTLNLYKILSDRRLRLEAELAKLENDGVV